MPAMVHATLIPATASELNPLLVLLFCVGEGLEDERDEAGAVVATVPVVVVPLLLLEGPEVTASFVIFI
jgi:hypothetical protein